MKHEFFETLSLMILVWMYVNFEGYQCNYIHDSLVLICQY